MQNSPADTGPAKEGQRSSGLLGDTAARDYASKLTLFNLFVEPELRQALATLSLEPGMRVLDAGCGSGEALQWLAAVVGEQGFVVGIDLAAAHAVAASRSGNAGIAVLQADLARAPFAPGSFDLIWSTNTINHLHDPVDALRQLKRLLRPNGRIVIAQSSLLPDMYFAWDLYLEQRVNDAVRRFFCDRYGLQERDLTSLRALVGLLRSAALHRVKVRTLVIERIAPLRPADEAYLLEAIFRRMWGERISPYLSAADFEQLSRLCDPDDECFALKRPDFHFIQTLTLVEGAV